MANQYTANYELCQWAPEDAFRREEFNQDNAKIDAAIQGAVDAAATAASAAVDAKNAIDQAVTTAKNYTNAALEPVGYNVANLLLGRYYEGKETGFKRAVVFDGFLDQGGVSSTSGAMAFGGSGPTVSRTGQETINLGYVTNGNYQMNSGATDSQTATGNGKLTGYTFQCVNNTSVPRSMGFTYTVICNDKAVLTGSGTTAEMGARVGLTHTITFPKSVGIVQGDIFSVSLRSGGSDWKLYIGGKGGLGGVLTITPLSGTSGSITTKTVSLPAFRRAVGWVRHTAGTASLSFGGNTMTRGSAVNTVSPAGVSCRETPFTLNASLGAGGRSATISLSLSSGESSARVLDYGVVLL